jgi:hypothetical protein
LAVFQSLYLGNDQVVLFLRPHEAADEGAYEYSAENSSSDEEPESFRVRNLLLVDKIWILGIVRSSFSFSHFLKHLNRVFVVKLVADSEVSPILACVRHHQQENFTGELGGVSLAHQELLLPESTAPVRFCLNDCHLNIHCTQQDDTDLVEFPCLLRENQAVTTHGFLDKI